MVGTSLSPLALPKAAALTEALVAPPDSVGADEALVALRQAFNEALASAAAGLGPDRLVIDAYRMRALTGGAPQEDRPFEWTPQTARRSIGIEAARACLARAGLTPLAATIDEVARLVRGHEQNGSRAGGLSAWLSGLSTGARAVVTAEAAGWTSQLVSSLEWGRLTEPVIGANRRVVAPGAPNVALRMRFEAAHRVRDHGTSGTAASLFMMMPGRPASTVQIELGLAALAVVLDDRTRSTPYRVIGWWPQSGRALVMGVDEKLLRDTADKVVAAVGRAPRSSHPEAPPATQRTAARGEGITEQANQSDLRVAS